MKSPLLEELLSTLKLSAIREAYHRVEHASMDSTSYLKNLAGIEVEQRQQNGIKIRMSAARFPTVKTFDTFDFSEQPDLPKLKLLEHTNGEFVREGRNVILYGPPGTGKTHCLIALGVSACVQGFKARFVTAAALLGMLLDAKRDGILTTKLRMLDRFHLLLIDELGYIPFEREATDLLFQVIGERYESKSIVITTNLPFEEWNQVFPTAMAATAVIDRLIHHGSVFELKGKSHRLRTRGGKASKASNI